MRAGLIISAILWAGIIVLLSGCGYALVRIPSAGERVSITTEQRVQSAFETAIDVAEGQVDPVGLYRQQRRR